MESASYAQIFAAIQELMSSQEFNEAQLTFMQSNVGTFDENEENKLEYMGIYESYVKIMEDIIDTRLLEQFSKNDIDSFYEHFRNNFQAYEAQDAETVDKVFELTDFVKFKESMLRAKSAINRDQSAGGETHGADPGTVGSKEFYETFHSEDFTDKSTGWKRRIHFENPKRGITNGSVYSKKIEGFQVEFTRSGAFYPGMSLKVFDNFMVCMEEMYMKKGGKGTEFITIEIDEATGAPTVVYFNFKMPMFMTDRDGCMRVTRLQVADNKAIYWTQSIDHPDYPVRSDRIRMNMTAYSIVEEVNGGLSMVEYTNADMKGYIPSSLINMTLGSIMQEEYTNMADMLNELKAQMA